MARPRTFDPEIALEAAMTTFWSHGFEGTSTAELMEAMSIGKRSLYDTFGDKRELYLASLRDYIRRSDEAQEALMDSELTPHERLEALLTPRSLPSAPRGMRDKAWPRGCFVNVASEDAAADSEVQSLITAHHNRIRSRYAEQMIRAGVPPQSAASRALVLHDAVMGYRTRARLEGSPGTDPTHLLSFAFSPDD